jgi:DNA polymerase III epsilon subunit-like protein
MAFLEVNGFDKRLTDPRRSMDLDSLLLAEQLAGRYPEARSISLDSAAEYYDWIHQSQHRALSDCYTTMQIARKIALARVVEKKKRGGGR